MVINNNIIVIDWMYVPQTFFMCLYDQKKEAHYLRINNFTMKKGKDEVLLCVVASCWMIGNFNNIAHGIQASFGLLAFLWRSTKFIVDLHISFSALINNKHKKDINLQWIALVI